MKGNTCGTCSTKVQLDNGRNLKYRWKINLHHMSFYFKRLLNTWMQLTFLMDIKQPICKNGC